MEINVDQRTPNIYRVMPADELRWIRCPFAKPNFFKNWHLQSASEEKGFKESSRLKDSGNFAVKTLAVDF
jgi:hypothetical protein